MSMTPAMKVEMILAGVVFIIEQVGFGLMLKTAKTCQHGWRGWSV
jgi:hypothetical protein